MRAVQQAGPVKLVAAHMGGWKQWEDAKALLADTQIYLDTSFSTGRMKLLDDRHCSRKELLLLEETEFLNMVCVFGPHRILFGTDSPWTGQSESLAWLQALPLSETEKAAVLGKNAQYLLGL